VQTARVLADRVGEIDFCVCDDRPTLIWLAQLAALELHPSLARATAIDSPTVLAFDLDPGPPASIVECCRVALILRGLFEGMGLRCFPKTSGSKGMQVYLPLNSGASYAETKPYAHAVAKALERSHPDLVVSRMTKELRTGKVFVDWSQNTVSKTTIAAYSLRARQRPTVSTPIDWDEVVGCEESGDPERLVFDHADVLARVESHGDLFAGVLELEQELPSTPASAL
jgi:bifunctional non-homologous end joining protein LigD